MAYIRAADVALAYDRIRRSSASLRTCTTALLVAPTPDALAALKILLSLLQSDLIPVQVIPLAGYDDLSSAAKQISSMKSVVLVGFGATVDVVEMLGMKKEMTAYIVDAHRPHALGNVFESPQVLILDDGYLEDHEATLKEAFVVHSVNRPQ